MNVLFTSAEVAPFAKAGGLGDVVGSLPKALRAEGVDARVLMPLYGAIDTRRYQIRPLFNFRLSRRNGTADVSISYTEFDDVPIYFLSSWPFFGEGNYIYGNWAWDMPRFIFFSQAIQAVAWQLAQGRGGHPHWLPDVLHFNDWHTGLGAFLLDVSRGDPLWGRMGSVQSIHNMAYQGQSAGGWLFDVGVPGRETPLLRGAEKDNLMAISIAYSDIVSTVSPRYALEIQYPRFGEGLGELVQQRARNGDVVGILNGIDPDLWNPATDPSLPHPYTVETFLEGRAANKAQMQRDAGLPVRADVPLIGMVSRLTDQKGIDLALPALRQLLIDTECQVIVLGTGDAALEAQLAQLAADFGWKARAYLQYNALISQRIYSAADLFLMPSRYEPCGTSQMLAMHYGSLPVVRETGGLADTVESYDDGPADRGTGFVFSWEEVSAVLNTLRWAISVYSERPQAFQRMQRRAMLVDFSWKKSAGAYVAMYEQALARHR